MPWDNDRDGVLSLHGITCGCEDHEPSQSVWLDVELAGAVRDVVAEEFQSRGIMAEMDFPHCESGRRRKR